MTYASTIAADSPTFYMPLDGLVNGGSGSVATLQAHASGITYDSTTAVSGSAAIFNGTNSSLYWGAFGSEIPTAFNGGVWSVEIWFKRSASATTNAYREVLNVYDTSNRNQIAIYGNDNTGHVGLWYNFKGAARTKITTTNTITDTNWHHAVATSNGTTVSFYIDNVLIGTGAAGTGDFDQSSTKIWLGAYGTATANENWWGELDEFAVYPTALSAAKVQAHYVAGGGALPNVTVLPPVISSPAINTVTPFVYSPINVTATIPAMAISLATADATPVMTSNALAIADRDRAGTTNSTELFMSTTYPEAYIKFPTMASTGAATLTLTCAVSNTNANGPVSVYLLTAPFTESGSSAIAHSGNAIASINLPATQTAGMVFTADVSSAVNAWNSGTPNYGLALAISGGGIAHFASRENTTYAGPKLSVTSTPTSKLVATSPIAIGLEAVAPAVAAETNSLVSAGAIGVGVSTPDAQVTAQITPDYTVSAGVMNVTLTTPAAQQAIRYPALAEAPAILVDLAMGSDVSVSLTTGRFIVAPAITITINLVGIYSAAADRYLTKVAQTVDADDIWYRLDEISGATRAIDYVSQDASNWVQSGYFMSLPGLPVEMQVPGPQLRKAARFDGVSNYLVVGPYNQDNQYGSKSNDVFSTSSLTVEFSIRTTQQNGVVFAGVGANPTPAQGSIANSGPTLTGNEVRLENGQLVITDGVNKLVARKAIADGEWHHIVMAIPSAAQMTGSLQSGLYDDSVTSYVAIDGKSVLARFGTFLGGSNSYGDDFIPYSFMARAKPTADSTGKNPVYSTSVNGFLAGELRDVIVRLNSYIPAAEAGTLYYEWSDSSLVQPNAMTVDLSAVPPFKVKGNTKKMLAIYGLQYGIAPGTNSVPLYTYMSMLSGMVIENMANTGFGAGVGGGRVNVGTSATTTGAAAVYWTPKVFQFNGYTVYPVSIVGDATTSGPISAAGILNPDATTQNGRFVDDATGLPRFINLQEDLAVDINDEFDVVTVVNYPWEEPNAGGYPDFSVNPIPSQPSMGLSQQEWVHARDALRDSILQAAYEGINLWIGEYYAAMHLGFIQGYDIHDPGYFGNLVYDNNYAEFIDNQHLAVGSKVATIEDGKGGYFSYPQVGFYRRIVAQVPNLTDIPSNEYGAWVEGWNQDDFLPNGNFLAYDVVNRPNGLQLGDLTKMSMAYPLSKSFGTTNNGVTAPDQHRFVVSAHPDGIAGTVIAREMDSYHGAGGVVVNNPYKNNAVTIAAERGTIVRGRPLGGRAFIELMDTDTTPFYIFEDANKNSWHGDNTSSPITTWSFDSRRGKEVKVAVTSTSSKFDPATGGFQISQLSTYYFTYEDVKRKYNLNVPMNARGLNWLANTPLINLDDAVVYTNPIEVNLVTPAPEVKQTKNPIVEVNGAMRVALELRQPANYSDGSVEEYVLPMNVFIEMRGLGRQIQAPPMSLTVTMVNPLLDVAADLVTVYMDSDREITLFLKED